MKSGCRREIRTQTKLTRNCKKTIASKLVLVQLNSEKTPSMPQPNDLKVRFPKARNPYKTKNLNGSDHFDAYTETPNFRVQRYNFFL